MWNRRRFAWACCAPHHLDCFARGRKIAQSAIASPIDRTTASSTRAIWDRWVSKDKSERKETYTIVTTAPSEFAAQFHDRMPCVLELKDLDQWLKDLPEEAATLMRPAKDVLQERPLGKAINNVKNNAPELLA
jgi:putative SOS response-associated peptidase YedK